jgi:hypothetical protein
MSYENRLCDRCGISDIQFYKTVPKWSYMNPNPLWSMHIGPNDEYWCGPCNKEIELTRLFKIGK